MPVFKYAVRDRHGNKIKGVIEADNADTAARELDKMGYAPISISAAGIKGGKVIFRKGHFVRQKTIAVFTRQLSTLIKSGLPVLASLKTLEKQAGNTHLKEVIRDVSREVEAGVSFSAALGHHPAFFNELYSNTVRAGEASGTMDEVLLRLADLIEHEMDVKARILGVVLYPVIAACFLSAGFLVLVTFVIPRFVKIFDMFHGQLPLPTRILIVANAVVQNYWYIGLAGLAAGVFLFTRWIRTKSGRKRWDGIKLRIPVIGGIILKLVMSRFSRILALLIRSGVPVLTVLDITRRIAGNTVISEAIDTIKVSVNEGKGMADPMRISGVFSPMVVQMVSVGEETGRIDELLYEVSRHYDREAENTIKNLAVIIEPVLIAILAVGVLIMALGIFLPMWSMYSMLVQ